MLQTLVPPIETDKENTAAEQGTAFHDKAEYLLKTYVIGERTNDGGLFKQIDTLCDNGVLFDLEMYDAVMVYTGDIFHYANQNDILDKIKVEERITLDCVFPGMYGHCDAYVVNKAKKEVVIWDGKYGYNIVEPFENWQLIAYAMGITQHIDGHEDQQWTVKLRISQPRAPHILGSNREWVIKLSDLRLYFNQLVSAANEALSGEGSTKAGSWCTYCEARHACDTLDRNVYAMAEYIGGVNPNELTGKALGVEYLLLERFQTLLKARMTGVEQQCLNEMRKGQVIPGLGIDEKFGRKRWKKDIDQNEVIMMGDAMGVDLRKPRELDTPTQCAKKGVDESVINEYSERPSNGFKVVKDNEARARMVFK